MRRHWPWHRETWSTDGEVVTISCAWRKSCGVVDRFRDRGFRCEVCGWPACSPESHYGW